MQDSPLPPDSHPAFLSQDEAEVSRRHFMKWMGAGAALLGWGIPACRRIDKFIIPYNAGPEWSIPGVETAYATCLTDHFGYAHPLMGVCYEGRPVKLIPSLPYPGSTGLSAAMQASILELYSPLRSRTVLFNGARALKDEFDGAFSSWARAIKSHGKVGILLPPTRSPLILDLLRSLQGKNELIKLYTYTPATPHTERMPLRIRTERLKRMLCIDSDILSTGGAFNTGEFADSETPEGHRYRDPISTPKMRLYAIESRLSLTGAHADHRLSVPPSRLPAILAYIADKLTRKSETSAALLSHHERQWIDACLKDLLTHRGESLIFNGNAPDGQTPLTEQLNKNLGSLGTSLIRYDETEVLPPSGIAELLQDLEAGRLDMLILASEGNPVFSSAEGSRLASLLPDIESIHLGLYEDETARACRWHIPVAHPLESWGIERDTSGRFCYRQPLILPLYGGTSLEELLYSLSGKKGILLTTETTPSHISPVYHRLRKCFEQHIRPDQKAAAWAEALRRGFSNETIYPVRQPQQSEQAHVEWPVPEPDSPKGSLHLIYTEDYSVGYGERKLNAWMQEFPDPITGVSWDASVQIAPETLKALFNLDEGAYRAALKTESGEVTFILCSIPGVARQTLVLPLGYGGTNCPEKTQSTSNAYPLLHAGIRTVPATALRLLDTPSQFIAQHSPSSAPPPFSTIFLAPSPDTPYADANCQWGMVIDATRCIGCNACIIACRAENNIPVVGRDQIAKGRAIDWIRIDKYISATGAMSTMPIACQQCASAPCESVCPVNATVHTSEGLNAMVYARCWGTRYCATNCPYKARKFNFFDYSAASTAQTRLQHNPNVTVRTRGVMEKCTYCVQMIEQAKIRHKTRLMQRSGSSTEWELTEKEMLLPDGAVRTACQMACPMQAISFGNICDPKSEIYRIKDLPRHFTILPERATFPATGYLTPVHNPNPEMPKEKK